MTPVVEVRAIAKRFPGVQALSGVDLHLKVGEIHALLGENGAGKSTLMKLLGGLYHPDGGEIQIDGQPVSIGSPARATALGIAFIHQELNLAAHLSVAENIFLGRPAGSTGPPCARAPGRCWSGSGRRSTPTPRWSGSASATGRWSRSAGRSR